ncbi:TPA: hypothetical protein IGZ65_005251 [Escherichia coli]|nr:hypothetical protein [Escherichia coli]
MSVDHTCFLDLAKYSLTLNGEMWTRNAVSRAYYSMYHSALRLTNNRVPVFPEDSEKLKGGIHRRVCTLFCSGEAATVKHVDVNAVKKIGVKLKMTHALRVNSDYRLELKINRITAISVIQDAEEVDTIVNQLLQSAARP